MEESNSEIKQEVKKVEVSDTSNTISKKDLLIPVSIVVAGLFVGAGLYFSAGTPATSNAPTGQNNGTQVQAGAKDLTELAVNAGVKKDDFTKCVESGETASVVDEQTNNAVETGGRGTPWSILIGPNGKKYPINGALPLANIDQVIAQAKTEAAQGPGSTEADLVLEKILPVTAEDNIRGDIGADYTIVEYSDFDCPFCQRFHGTMKSVMEKYDGEVAWVYRHFPLTQLHPNAKNVAIASECVAQLGGNEAFWKFADAYTLN